MFSTAELLHLVFANPNDTYYRDDLLKLSLNQYLWLRLHEDGFQAVYFLQPDGDLFTVRTYGDLACTLPVSKFSFFKTKTELFGEWMLSQMRARDAQRAAFLCPMEVFCQIAQGEAWERILCALAREQRRTGILVLTAPPEAERSMPLLLRSGVFGCLNEQAILHLRSGTLCPLYLSLAIAKPSSLVYLSSYTPPRLRTMLLHVMVDAEVPSVTDRELSRMASYLSRYLYNPWLRRAEPLFGPCRCNEYPEYRELYRRFCNRRLWERLHVISEWIRSQESWSVYLKKLPRQALDYDPGSGAVFPLRDHGTTAGHCLALWPPAGLAGGQAETAFQLITEIHNVLLTPKNRLDNAAVMDAMETFRGRLGAAQGNEDWDTYCRLLTAIRFFALHLTAEPSSQEEEQVLSLPKQLEALIEQSELIFQLRQQRQHFQAQADHNPLAQKLIQTDLDCLERTLSVQEELLEELEGRAMAKMAQVSRPWQSGNLRDLIKALQQKRKEVPQEIEEEDLILPTGAASVLPS